MPRAALSVAVSAAVVFVALLFASRRFDFYYDEWDFVLGAADWKPRDYLVPHSGHWVTLPRLAYAGLLGVGGVESYPSFMALLLLLHVAATALLFLLVRRHAGDVPALVSAAALLVLSRGWQNILWAFQVGFLGSVVAGLLAMYLLDAPPVSRPRIALASIALLLGLMCSAVGLVFVAALAVELLTDRRRRSCSVALAVPAVAWLTWYVSFGRSQTPDSLLSIDAVLGLVGYVPAGIGAAAAGLIGLGPRFGPAALAVVTALVAVRWTKAGGVDSRALGAAAGLVTLFVLAGLVRWQHGDTQAASSRYVYVGGVFLLVILAEVWRELPWRGRFKLGPLLVVPVVALDVVQLAYVASIRERMFETQAAMLRTLWLFRDAPGLDRDAIIDPTSMPQVRAGAYLAFRRRSEPSVPRTTLEDVITTLPASAVNRLLTRVFRLEVSSRAGDGSGDCVVVDAAVGFRDVTAASGATVRVSAAFPGPVDLAWWLVGPEPAEQSGRRRVEAATAIAVKLPDAGPGVRWHLRVRPPPGSSVCGPTDAANRRDGSHRMGTPKSARASDR